MKNHDEPMSDEELMDEVWDIAFNGLEAAYEMKHDFDQKGASEEDKKWAQGKADAFRLILASMRGHSRFVSKANNGTEASGAVTDEMRETAQRLGLPLSLGEIDSIIAPDYERLEDD